MLGIGLVVAHIFGNKTLKEQLNMQKIVQWGIKNLAEKLKLRLLSELL